MYVQRDEKGVVKGVFRWPQPGYAEENLNDDHPEVVEFLMPKPLVDQVALLTAKVGELEKSAKKTDPTFEPAIAVDTPKTSG